MDIDKLEQFLQERVFPELHRGRPTDEPHTQLVVSKLKEIIKHSPEIRVDLPVLIIAAYAHDWGYSGLFEADKPLDMASIGEQKKTHMEAGAAKLRTLLEDPFFNFLTPEQKQRAVHLVSVHDKLNQLHDTDELILMEADSLGGMEPDVMGGFEEKESEERFMRQSKELRFSRFITGYGKKEFERLFQKRMEFNKSRWK